MVRLSRGASSPDTSLPTSGLKRGCGGAVPRLAGRLIGVHAPAGAPNDLRDTSTISRGAGGVTAPIAIRTTTVVVVGPRRPPGLVAARAAPRPMGSAASTDHVSADTRCAPPSPPGQRHDPDQ